MPTLTPAQQELFEERARFVDRFNAGDVEAIVQSFDERVVLIPPDREVAVGHDGARELFGAMAGGGARIEHGPVATVTIHGDLAYTVGCYTVRIDGGGEPVELFGRSLEVWRRAADGSWKTIADMWRDTPVAPEGS